VHPENMLSDVCLWIKLPDSLVIGFRDIILRDMQIL